MLTFLSLGWQFVKGLNPKVIIGIVLIVAIGIGVWMWHSKNEKIDTLTKKNEVQQTVIKQDTQSIQESSQSAAITNTITAQAAADVATTTQKHEQISQAVQQKINTIENNYQGKPMTPQVQQQMDDQISGVIIDGLWQSYCTAEPGDTNCAANTSTTN